MRTLTKKFLAIAAILLILIIFKFPFNSRPYPKDLNHCRCFLENILSDEQKIVESNGNQIFFIETHLDEFRDLKSARQACSVESAALMNPEMQVYLLFATKSNFISMKYSDLTDALMSYPNVNLRFLNIFEYSNGTLLEDFFIRNKLAKSKFQLEHTSDALRMLTLQKFGGIYLDLDVVCLVPFKNLNFQEVEISMNFGCSQGLNDVAPAIVRVDVKSGKKVMETYLKSLSKTYKPKAWSANGPKIFTESLRKFCPGIEIDPDVYTQCGNFTILPSDKCFAIHYSNWHWFYEEEFTSYAFESLKEAKSFFVHTHNKMQDFNNKTYDLRYDSKAAYIQLAKKYCPKVYDTLLRSF